MSSSSGDEYAPTPKIFVKCRAHRLVDLISGLNDAQRQSVKRIGFGGLLEMKLSAYPLKYASLFMDAFSDGSHLFRASETKEFLVTKHDVHDCFLLPLGPREMELVLTGRKKTADADDSKQLKDQWRNKYKVAKPTDPITTGKVLADLKSDKEGGDEFCRLFVLFSMSTFLCPTSNNGIDLKLLRAVDDVSAINQYDWCSYVLHGMANAGWLSRNNPKFLLGCIPFLMITYLQRFDFRGEILPHDLPLIKHWDEQKMIDRLQAELISGSLGRQTWSSVKYPRCLQTPMQIDSKFHTPLKIGYVGMQDSTQGPMSSTPMSNIHKKFIQIELPPGVDDDQELQAKAVDGVHALYLKIQRNAVAFHAWYADATTKIKLLTSQQDVPSDLIPSQSTQAFFEDERLHRYVDEVIEIATRMRDSVSKAPTFGEQSTRTQHNTDEERFNGGETEAVDTESNRELLCQLYDSTEIDVVLRSLKESEKDKEPEAEAEEGGEAVKEAGSEPGEGVRGGDEADTEKEGSGRLEVDMGAAGSKAIRTIYVPHTTLVNHPFLFHSHTPLPCMVVVPENLGCSLDCGAPDTDQWLVSNTLCSDLNMFATVFSVRKEVMDYVFNKSKEYSNLELFVKYNEWFYINREDMSSLEPGVQVLTNVTECWCLLLNQITHEKTAPVQVSRCFFGLSHNGFILDIWKAQTKGEVVDVSKDVIDTWDMWIQQNIAPLNLDSDMVFIPVLSGDKDHYSCACINFLSEQVEYLDNRFYGEDFDIVPYVGLARIAANEMGKYMVSKGFNKGSRVSSFKLVNVEFSWQKQGSSANNCGVYMMVHMLLYCGKAFDCGLDEDDAMPLYRAEIAATLVLSDINIERDNVQRSIATFKESKLAKTISTKKNRSARTKHSASKRKAVPAIEGDNSKRSRRSDGVSTPLVNEEPTGSGSTVDQPRELQSPNSRPMSAVKCTARGQGDGLGCSLDLGESDATTTVVSQTFRSHQKLLKDLPSLRKHVVDYCLLDDYNNDINEPLARYGDNAILCRKDILSMLPEYVMSESVIECWSMLLNQIESDESKVPRMAFFGIRHMEALLAMMVEHNQSTQKKDGNLDGLYNQWDLFVNQCGTTLNLKADLIFIPVVIEGHFLCVCINFKLRTVFGLDHQYRAEWENCSAGKVSKIIADSMSDYLETRGNPRGGDIPNFKHRQLALQGQIYAPNVNESGIFTMMYMLLYEGALFEHNDLGKRMTRRYLAVELAAALVLADVNILRDEVLEKVNKFVTNKDAIWTQVQAKRKLAKYINKL